MLKIGIHVCFNRNITLDMHNRLFSYAKQLSFLLPDYSFKYLKATTSHELKKSVKIFFIFFLLNSELEYRSILKQYFMCEY
jgi:hypothetical protein